MKKINLLIVFLFCLAGYGQTENFIVDSNSKIIWQKVFNEKLDINDLKKNLILEFTDDSRGNVNNFKISGKKMPLIFRNEIIAGFLIEDRGDRYRVTVSNIRFIDSNSFFEKEEALENYFLRKGKFSGRGWDNGSEALDNYFTSLFEMHNNSTNDDW